jgi:predicted 3-demethylubiquinone-9 3-methyltransferase (glyoxalase superfamily)
MTKQKIIPHLWYDYQALEAAKFYVSVFKKNSRITGYTHYGKEGYEIHRMKEGTVMTVSFLLNGQEFIAINAGPMFKFNEAISFMVMCKNQKEIDYFWNKLSAKPKAEICGWLKDKYGLSWQIVPAEQEKWMKTKDKKAFDRVMKEILRSKKLNINKLRKAFEGK